MPVPDISAAGNDCPDSGKASGKSPKEVGIQEKRLGDVELPAAVNSPEAPERSQQQGAQERTQIQYLYLERKGLLLHPVRVAQTDQSGFKLFSIKSMQQHQELFLGTCCRGDDSIYYESNLDHDCALLYNQVIQVGQFPELAGEGVLPGNKLISSCRNPGPGIAVSRRFNDHAGQRLGIL